MDGMRQEGPWEEAAPGEKVTLAEYHTDYVHSTLGSTSSSVPAAGSCRLISWHEGLAGERGWKCRC